MPERRDFSGFGMPEREIRKMQERVSREVDEKKEEDQRILDELAKEREMEDLKRPHGLSKTDMRRTEIAKR
ncbi:MAG: hypothetical protein PHY34_00610 [Patescibacteria group bacterium]|nr:hypothetical protein [Patescibacteria group bacterium]MDD5715869.1 hypothetical protein [Patescibacteria group bacterium]